MSVAELIDRLKLMDGEMVVVCNGYEGGFDPISIPKKIFIKIDNYRDQFTGEYEICRPDDPDVIEAVWL